MMEKEMYVFCFFVIATASIVNTTLIDLSHEHGFNTIMSPKNPRYKTSKIFQGDLQPGVYAKFNSYSLGEHGGTHLDAPVHFKQDGIGLDQIPLEKTIVDGVMIDCSQEAALDSNHAATLEKVKEWEKKNGEIPKGAAIVFNFDWSKNFHDKTLYFNTSSPENTDTYRFPHISKEACDWLVDERDISILALDTPSPDLLVGKFPVHVKLLKSNRLIVENLKDPSRLPAKGFRFHATPVKFVGGTGTQVRAFAVVHESINKAGLPSFSLVSMCGAMLVFLLSYFV